MARYDSAEYQLEGEVEAWTKAVEASLKLAKEERTEAAAANTTEEERAAREFGESVKIANKDEEERNAQEAVEAAKAARKAAEATAAKTKEERAAREVAELAGIADKVQEERIAHEAAEAAEASRNAAEARIVLAAAEAAQAAKHAELERVAREAAEFEAAEKLREARRAREAAEFEEAARKAEVHRIAAVAEEAAQKLKNEGIAGDAAAAAVGQRKLEKDHLARVAEEAFRKAENGLFAREAAEESAKQAEEDLESASDQLAAEKCSRKRRAGKAKRDRVGRKQQMAPKVLQKTPEDSLPWSCLGGMTSFLQKANLGVKQVAGMQGDEEKAVEAEDGTSVSGDHLRLAAEAGPGCETLSQQSGVARALREKVAESRTSNAEADIEACRGMAKETLLTEESQPSETTDINVTARPSDKPVEAGEEATWTFSAWVKSLELHESIAQKLGISDGEEALQRCKELTENELREKLADAKLEGLYSQLWQGLQKLKTQESSATASMQSKFAHEEGTFEMSFANLSTFFAGLEGLIGSPNPRVMDAMREEHCSSCESTIEFVTGNYGVSTTSAQEWDFVVTKSGEDRKWPVESPDKCPHMRQWKHLDNFSEDMNKINERLQQMGEETLIEAEVIALRLYTGPMSEKYWARLGWAR